MDKRRRVICKVLFGSIAAGGTIFSIWDLVWAELFGGASEPSLRHTFRVNPLDAFRHNKVGVKEEGSIDFSRQIREQFDRSGRLDCVMEFVTSERKSHGWKVVVTGPHFGFIEGARKTLASMSR